MILYEFDHERPQTLEQASALLRNLGGGARLAAGGTDLLPNMRVDIVHPSTVVSLAAIAPEPPRREPDGSIRIDALTRLADIEVSPLIRESLPMLAAAARAVASTQIRQMGTLGGNLCQDTRCLYLNQKHDYQFGVPCYKRGGDCCYPYPTNKPGVCWSVHMSDTAPALIALGAGLEILGAAGTRRMSLEDLYTGDGVSPLSLASDDIVRAVVVPRTPARFGWGYHKSARRGGLEFGVAVMAAALSVDENGCCESPRIAIGAVRERPIRLASAEHALAGVPLDDKALADAAAAVAHEVNPLPHHGFTKMYVRDDLRIRIRRVLASALAQARSGAEDGKGESDV